MSERVVIVGIGMLTAVGLSAAETAASVRTGTARFLESSIRDHRFEPFTLAEAPDEELPALEEAVEATVGLTSRERRMLRLADQPLRECLAALGDKAPKPGLVLALPETKTTIPLEPKVFLRMLERQTGGVFDLAASEAPYVGRAGGLRAIGRASAWLRNGKSAFVVAGGVDTYRDLYVLGTLDMEKRVKSSSNLDGFVPGEGAGFLLLATETAARKFDLQPVASLSPVAEGFESGHLYSDEAYRGDGLAGTIRDLLQSAALDGLVCEVYSSMNGESHWGKEWGVSFLRNRSAFDEEHGIQHPADCYGDTGAASGPIMVGLAALGMAAGHVAPPALVYASSDLGERAAVAVSLD